MYGKSAGQGKNLDWVLSGSGLRDNSEGFGHSGHGHGQAERRPGGTEFEPKKNRPGTKLKNSFDQTASRPRGAEHFDLAIRKRQLVEIDVSDQELEIPVPPSLLDRSVFSKPEGTDELTTTESSTRRLFHGGDGFPHAQLSAKEFRQKLMAAKKKFLSGDTVVEIEISDDEQKKEREIASLKAKIREAEAERERLARLHKESERQKEIEKEKVAKLEREKKEKEKEKKPVEQDYPEDKYLKQLSGIYKAAYGKTGNRLSMLVEKEQVPAKESFASRFQVLESLGEGSSCVVRKVLCKKNNKIFAVKSCKSNDQTSISYIKKEHKILKMLTHDNIIKTYGIFESTSNVRLTDQDPSNPQVLRRRDPHQNAQENRIDE